MQDACDIVILSMNNYRFTKACLTSIFSCDAGFPFFVHVFDNASVDGSPDNIVRDFRGRVRVWRSDSNLGFSGGNNIVLERTRCRFACLLNNDTIVTPGWLGEMVAAEQEQRVGIVGPRGNNANSKGQPEQAVDFNMTLDQMDPESLKRVAGRLSRAQPRFSEVSCVVGYCMLLRRSMLGRIGLLDTRFWPGNFEDDDLCLRATEAGYRIVVANRSLVYHFVSSTFKIIKLHHMFSVNRELFRSKWIDTGRKAALGVRRRPRLRLAVEMSRDRAAAHRVLSVCDELRLRGAIVHTFGPLPSKMPTDCMIPHVMSASPEKLYADSAVVLHQAKPPANQSDCRVHVCLTLEGRYNPSKDYHRLVLGRLDDWRFAPRFVSIRWSRSGRQVVREGVKNLPYTFYEMVDGIEKHLLGLQEMVCKEIQTPL